MKIFNIAYIEISEKKLVKKFFLVTLIKNVTPDFLESQLSRIVGF